MRYPLKTLTPFELFRSNVYRTLRWPYLTAGISAYGFIILLAILYMSQAPKFKSEMDLVLPGTGASSNVSLNEVGQVVSQTTAPFSAGGFNPRVNYKEMLSSRGVLARAAETMALSTAKFGKPKVKLTEQTSIISITVSGTSAEQAKEKAWTLYEALQAELDHLRTDEVERRDASIKNVLQQYRERMNLARNSIVDFQQRSFLVSIDQMEQTIGMLTRINEKRLLVGSELKEMSNYINHMSLNLGVSPKLAGQALVLQSDPEFKSYISELDTSTSLLTEYQARWGNKHPKVIAESRRQASAKTALQIRGQEVTGIFTHDLFNTLSLESNPKRAQLFADLVEAYARKEGHASMLKELDRSSIHLSDQLKVYSREVAELDRLQREFDLAEAVFTSAAARLEANKADVFASYPVIQMLTTPSLPVLQSSPNPLIAIIASIAGILFITFGLLVIWQRNNIAKLLLKKS